MERCRWVGDDPILRAYHDEEWGVALRDPRALWEQLVLEGFQAGLSWIIVLRKRAAFRAAFAGFAPERVARFTATDVERLLGDPGIIRSRAKIAATIKAAALYCDMTERGEDFAAFCWGFTHGETIRGDGHTLLASTPLSETISRALRQRGFSFVGPTIVHAWMQAVGIVDDHESACFRHAATIRP